MAAAGTRSLLDCLERNCRPCNIRLPGYRHTPAQSFQSVTPWNPRTAVIRVLRLLRVFRIFKLGHYLDEADVLTSALRASRRKIEVFLVAVFTLVILFGALMYVVEGEANGFTSIPVGVYWAIVTLTTVGYGDISPQTPLGQAVAAIIMIVGYAIIAVPTGIVTAEIAYAGHAQVSTQACPQCGIDGHEYGARFCRQCGARL